MSIAEILVGDTATQRDFGAANLVQLYDALVESTAVAVVITALDGTILSWDAGAEQMYGLSAEAAIRQPLSLITPADRAGEALSGLRSIARGERIDALETVRLRADKTRIDVVLNGTALRDDDGRTIAAMFVTRDITAVNDGTRLLRMSQSALADANTFLQKAERLSRTGSWTLQLGAEWTMRCSPETYRVLGIADDTPITLDLFWSFVHPDDRENVEATMTAALVAHESYDVEYRVICLDGTTRWVHAWAEAEYDDDGEPIRVLGVVQDVTERNTAEEQLRASERRFRLLAENARDLIFRIVLEPEPRFDYVSPAAFAITGYTAEEICSQPALATTLVSPDHTLQMASLHDSGSLSEAIDIEIRRKDGTKIWVSQQLTLVHDDDGVLIAVEGIDRDITERKRSEDERAYGNLHDRLTGLANRQQLHDDLEQSRARALRNDHELFVVSLDLDGFTVINHTHGFETGDAALVAVADLLNSSAVGNMSVGRTGSDEFVVVGDAVDGAATAAAFVERVRTALDRPIRCNGIDLLLHACMGVAVGDRDQSGVNLTRDSGIALARAKQHRTDTGVEIFDAAMRTRANEHLALVNDLYVALERNEFVLHYQPVVRLTDDRIIGAEALIRWNHPERGVVDPAQFIPLAEATGLIVAIGAWALNEACDQLRDWSRSDAGLTHLTVAVNLSVVQLRAPGIVVAVAKALERTGIDPGRVTLEVTESVFADDLAKMCDVLSELRTLGVRTAIDDFGTGYSSLSYLKRLPIDTLKIDKTFVDDLVTDSADAVIVHSALSICRALGLAAVAEGVETREQRDALRALGCDAVQGFYYSGAVTGTAFAALATPAGGCPPDLAR